MYGVEQNVNEPALIVKRVLKDREKRRKEFGLCANSIVERKLGEQRKERIERWNKERVSIVLCTYSLPKSHVQVDVAQFQNAVVSASTCISGDEWILEPPGC